MWHDGLVEKFQLWDHEIYCSSPDCAKLMLIPRIISLQAFLYLLTSIVTLNGQVVNEKQMSLPPYSFKLS